MTECMRCRHYQSLFDRQKKKRRRLEEHLAEAKRERKFRDCIKQAIVEQLGKDGYMDIIERAARINTENTFGKQEVM